MKRHCPKRTEQPRPPGRPFPKRPERGTDCNTAPAKYQNQHECGSNCVPMPAQIRKPANIFKPVNQGCWNIGTKNVESDAFVVGIWRQQLALPQITNPEYHDHRQEPRKDLAPF